MVIDFRKNAPKVQPLLIQDREVNEVEYNKYFGAISDTTLKFQQNVCPEETEFFLYTKMYFECIL